VTDIRYVLEAHEHELIAFRRHLHTQPEASGKEYLTTELLVERLSLEGLKPHVLGSGTGVVCDIPLDPEAPVRPGETPIVALRADIDGLEMEDLTGAPYRSRFPGLAHACGHDVHTAAVLGAALALLQVRQNAPREGVVRLIFEPSEEAVPGGALEVIAEGWLEHVNSIYGVHCDPKLDVGTLGVRSGPLTSAADQFAIELGGPGGHTARPRETVDLIRWTARVADRLWDEVQARLDHPVTLVFGSVHTGAAANVIPASAFLRGSFRTADRPTWAAGEDTIRDALAALFEEDGIGEPPRWALEYGRGLPPVVNDAATSQLVREVVARQFGPTAVSETPQSVGGDTFAWYTERIPGTYVRLGTHDPDSGDTRQDLHSATFDVDERSIGIGATVLAGCAIAALD